MALPPSLQLPTLDLLGVKPETLPNDPVRIQHTAEDWFNVFAKHIQDGPNYDNLVNLFTDISPSWRDLLALTWDFRTFVGKDKIAELLTQHLSAAKIENLQLNLTAHLQRPDVDLAWIQAGFTFTTEHGTCSGVLRLVPVAASESDIEWKAHGILTNLESLKRFPEKIGLLREKSPSYGLDWQRHRERELLCEKDPIVLVIGAGHAGLMVAARLKYLGVPTLVVEKTPRVGDVWRNRYASLALHDPVWFNHFAYLPYPPTWPVFAPAQKVADWLESYAKILDLNVWTSAEVSHIARDKSNNCWNVNILRINSNARTLKVKHVVVASGLRGGIPRMPAFEGSDEFDGQIMHSSQFTSARDFDGKKVVVVGSGSSGFDISVDCARNDMDVTMYQRGPTTVMSANSFLGSISVYSENGPPVDVADRINASIPLRLGFSLASRMNRIFAEKDKEMRAKLSAKGFLLTDGPKDAGFLGLVFARSGGYYFDQGGSELIHEEKIKLKHGEISRLTSSGIEFTDGSHLSADVIVCATGYQDGLSGYRPILGNDIASKVKPLTTLDDEGEITGVVRKTGVPNLWVITGTIKMSRFYSSHLAMQIKAVEEGILGGE